MRKRERRGIKQIIDTQPAVHSMLNFDFLHIVIDTSEYAQFVLIRVLNKVYLKSNLEEFLIFQPLLNVKSLKNKSYHTFFVF